MLLFSFPVLAANELSFNAGEFLEKATLSKVLGGSSAGWFLPFHFTYSRDLDEEFQIASDFIYRMDNHVTFDEYQEYLLLAGVGYRFRPDLIGTFKVGGGRAAGTISSLVVSQNNFTDSHYSCSEIVAQAGLQKRSKLSDSWDMGLGGGLLVIIPTACQNEFPLSVIGILVHRIVPILNWDLVYKF